MSASWSVRPDFTWPVALGGYRVELAEETPSEDGYRYPGGSKMMVTDGLPPWLSAAQVRYDRPLDEQGALFLIFADTDLSAPGVTTFASSYGLLGGDLQIPVSLTLKKDHRVEARGEPLEAWYASISSLRREVRLWELLRGGEMSEAETDELIKYFAQWPDSGRSGIATRDQLSNIEQVLLRDPSLRGQLLHEIFRTGANHLRETISEHLEGHVALEIIDLPRTDRSLTRILGMRPETLLHALWLQFAQAMNEKRQYVRCRECSTWFEIVPGIHRSSRQFCSSACRSRSYRTRQEEVRRLHSEGLGTEEIAIRVGTDARTAKRWIDKK